MAPESKSTRGQNILAALIAQRAPARWKLLGTKYLPQARSLMMAWEIVDFEDEVKTKFEIYISRKTTYADVKKAYPDLPESPVVAAS